MSTIQRVSEKAQPIEPAVLRRLADLIADKCSHVTLIKAAVEDLPALARLAARLEPSLRKRFLAAVAKAQGQVELEALAQAIEANSVTRAMAAAKLAEFPETFGELAADLRAGFFAGSNFALVQLASEASISMRFDVVNPQAVQAARLGVAQRIVQPFLEDAKAVITDIVTRSVGGEMTPASAARLIREVIGLDPRRADALAARRERLIQDGRWGDALERAVARYAKTLLIQRSQTIARTEIMTIVTKGQRAAWDTAAQQGLLRQQDWVRTWITTQDERLCDICGPLHEESVAFDGEFALGDPPAHPNCRCTIRLERS